MTKNPFFNALAATLYIFVIANVMFYGTKNIPGPDNSVIAPIVFLSVFTLSAATMGYLFLSQPLQLYFDGKKKNAVNLFGQTLAVFAGITALILVTFLSGIFS